MTIKVTVMNMTSRTTHTDDLLAALKKQGEFNENNITAAQEPLVNNMSKVTLKDGFWIGIGATVGFAAGSLAIFSFD
jgi:hypothetical protein